MTFEQELTTENVNTIYWDAVSDATPFTQVRTIDMMRRVGRISWVPMNSAAVVKRKNEANEDIMAGRMRRFKSVEDLLDSLPRHV